MRYSIFSVLSHALQGNTGWRPVWRDAEPGVNPSAWSHFVDRLTGRERRDGWTEDDE